jgi:hypothetical protein
MVTILGLAAVNAAAAQGKSSLVLGIGRMSCAHWQSSPPRQREGAIWIFGYWSGINHVGETTSGRLVGQHTDSEGIVAEVKKVCEAQPSMTLMDATATAYLAQSKR